MTDSDKNCPHCGTHIDDHPASHCMDLWVMQDVFGWTTSIRPYKGDFYPKGSYFVSWNQPHDFHPEFTMIISQAFDKDENNLRSAEGNPLGVWDETGPPIPLTADQYSLRFSTETTSAKEASDKAGHIVIFSPGASVRDGSYANRKNDWLVEMIPKGGITEDSVWAYGETEELARCRAAIKASAGKNTP